MMNDDNQMNPNKRMNKKILDEDGNEEERMSLPDPEDDDVIIYGEGDLDDLISQNSHDEDDNENQTNINLLQKELIDEYGDEDLDGVEIDDSEWNDLADDLTPGVNAAKNFFLSRLIEDLSGYSTAEDIKSGWKVRILTNTRGPTKGLYEVWYIGKNRKKYKTRVLVQMSLGLIPYCRSGKSMPRYLVASLAAELRERFLVSGLLFSHPSPSMIREIYYSPDEDIRAKCIDSEDLLSNKLVEFCSKSYYFACGNTTVINWGKIISNGHFHSRNEIYPLGFKAIRQEYDELRGCLVDCYCEIDCYSNSDPSKRYSSADLDSPTLDVRADIRPLFRVTVAWNVDSTVMTKVYEGKTPQVVWQLIIREQIGLSDSSTSAGSVDEPDFNLTDFEDADDEEHILRYHLMELQKQYLKSVNQGKVLKFLVSYNFPQRISQADSFQSRLHLDSTEYFNELWIQRLLEGMTGVAECTGYDYFDSRGNSLKNAIEKYLASANQKLKFLDHASQQKYEDYVTTLSKGIDRSVAVEHNATPEVPISPPSAEVVLSKKRTREEQKQEKIRKTNIELKRKSRMRDLERLLKCLKDEENHALILRKYTARVMVEQHAQQEEENLLFPPHKIPSCESLPLTWASNDQYPIGKLLYLDNDIFGRCLELWAFLFTYSKLLEIAVMPSQSHFELNFSTTHRLVHQLMHWTNKNIQLTGISYLSPYFAAIEPLLENSGEKVHGLMSKIGIALTRPLVEEYYSIMGMDAHFPTFEVPFHLPVNDMLWKEIARVVLFYTLCKSYHMSDYEATIFLKGKGYVLTGGDIHEKRIMRLIKRRILCRYHRHMWRSISFCSPDNIDRRTKFWTPSLQHQSYSHLDQELRSGLLVSIPTPSLFMSNQTASSPAANILLALIELFHVLLSLQSYSHSITVSCFIMMKDAVSHLLTRLKQYEIENDTLTGILVLLRALATPESAERCRGHDYYFQLWSTTLYFIQRAVDCSYYQYNKFTYHCAVDVVNFPTPPIFKNSDLTSLNSVDLRLQYSWTIPSPNHFSEDTKSLIVDFEQTRIHSAGDLYRFLSNLSAIVTATCRYNAEQHLLASKLDQDDEQFGISSTLADKDEDDNLETNSQPDFHLETEETRIVREAEQLQTLTELSQRFSITVFFRLSLNRCFYVLQILMEHNLAEQFNFPVDAVALPKYYNFIRHPLSLSDIRHHLTAGSYANNAANFYRDVNLVLQNAVAFNAETTAIAQASLKLSVVFERLFYEYVLNVEENPLNKPETCLICRVAEEDEDDDQLILCDRCDGYYHVTCLPSPVQISSKAEWYCPSCIEEKDISHIHPLRHAVVKNPDSNTRNGEYGRVVGIVRKEAPSPSEKFNRNSEDVEYYLEYHIEFGYSMEDLDYIYRWKTIGRGSECTSVWMLDQVLKCYYGFCPPKNLNFDGMKEPDSQAISPCPIQCCSPPSLPSGYTYAHYDTVGSIAQAYTGWYSSQSALPPCLDVRHSKAAYLSNLNNDRLEFIRASLFPLTTRGFDCEMDTDDWINLLLAISYKTMTMPSFVTHGSTLNDQSSSDYSQILSNLENNKTPSLSDYKGFIDVEIGDTLLFRSEVKVDTPSEDQSTTSSDDGDSEPDVSSDDLFTAEEYQSINVGEMSSDMTIDPIIFQKSVQKGSEDALLCFRLLLRSDEHLAFLEEETLEDNQSLCTQIPDPTTLTRSCLLPYFLPGGYLHSIVKFFAPREAGDCNHSVWLSTFCEQLCTLLNRHIQARKMRVTDEQCAWCKYTELELCSRMVQGKSYLEWKDVKQNNKYDASRDLKDSLRVHEYCAEIMDTRREKLYNKRLHFLSASANYNPADSMALADTLSGYARGKIISIGRDRYNNHFYLFPGTQDLFVFHNYDSPLFHESLIDSRAPERKNVLWRVYSDLQDLRSVHHFLNCDIECEKNLKNIIRLLYPEAIFTISNDNMTREPVDIVMYLKSNNLGFESLLSEPITPNAEPEFEAQKIPPLESDESDLEVTPITPREIVTIHSDDEEVEWDETTETTSVDKVTKPSKRRNELMMLATDVTYDKERASSRSVSNVQYVARSKVIVMRGGRYYEGKIVTVSSTNSIKETLYKVRFIGWGMEYDSWLDESALIPLTSSTRELLSPPSSSIPPCISDESDNISDEDFTTSSTHPSIYQNLPTILQSLIAFQYLHAHNRHNTQHLYSYTNEPLLPNITYQYSNNQPYLHELNLLKMALLMIQSALPRGSLDDHEEKWSCRGTYSGMSLPSSYHPSGSSQIIFLSSWRHGIINSSNFQELMEYELMLEYCLKSSWYKAHLLKIISCLPSRSHCLRYATSSLLSMRIWLLDQAIKYEKVMFDTPGGYSSEKRIAEEERTAKTVGGDEGLAGKSNKKSKLKKKK